MAVPGLTRYVSNGVTLLGDTARPGGVTLAFTERTGGCSTGRFSSLNLSLDCDDDEKSVRVNRERVMAAIGAGADAGRLVSPRQVHGDRLVVVDDGSDEAVARLAADAREGADGVVCCVPGVPVLLCYADCVPVVLVQHGAFAVVHSGWRGTRARIAAKALGALCELTGLPASCASAYVGPHIEAADYEVSVDLAREFAGEFGDGALLGRRNLDLSFCITSALVEAGMSVSAIASCGVSTPHATDRFYSYRASRGACGRHGAVAYIPRDTSESGGAA